MESSFHLRGTHLYLMLDDINARAGFVQEILTYLETVQTRQQRIESVFVKGAMSREAAQQRIPEAMALQIFQALSHLPNIERLEVSGDGRFGGLFLPVQAMTLALQNQPQHLFSLRLGNVILTTRNNNTNQNARGDNLDIVDLANALKGLPSLTSIDLVRCRAESDTVSLGPLIHSISTTPTLQQAMFCETLIATANSTAANGTGSFLSDLCTSPSLKKLWWKTMPDMTNDHIVFMARQLKTNTVLTELTIRSHGLGKEAGEAIADMLFTNKTLQVINLDLDRPEYGLAIAEALHKNASLQCLDVWAWNGGNEEGSHSNPDRITDTFTTMLQHNHVLRFLTFQGLDWNNPEVDFYLRLNRAGRQALLQNANDKRQWMETLIQQKEDIALVYYFLSLNPEVCYPNHDDSIGVFAISSSNGKDIGNLKRKAEEMATPSDELLETSATDTKPMQM